MKKSKSNNKGSALFLAILVTSVLMILGSGFLNMVNNQARLMLRSHAGVEAEDVAEAAVEMALWEFSFGGADFLSSEGWNAAPPITSSGTLTDNTGTPAGDYDISIDTTGDIIITGIGYYPDRTRPLATKTVKVRITENRMFTKAIASLEQIRFNNFNYMDSYNADAGPYGGSNVSANADFITNSTSTADPYAIDVGQSSYIGGDLFVGPGGDPTSAIVVGSGTTITGDLKTSDRNMRFSSIPAPTGLTPMGDLTVNAGPPTTISGNLEFGNVLLKPNSTLIIDADSTLYISGDFTTKPNTNIIIQNSATVHIVLNGNIAIQPGTIMDNQSFDPKKFTIYGTNNVTSFSLQPGAQFFGNLYLPNASIQVQPGTTVFGAVAGKSVTFMNNVTVHFDESLATSDLAPSFSTYLVENWQSHGG